MTAPLELRSVELRVANLSRGVEFYTQQVGFVVAKQTPQRAELTVPGADAKQEALLVLSADPKAPPEPPDAAGLFHAALLLPSRAALGRWLRFAKNAGLTFAGFSDHGVSEAVYFSDPEGNGLEFYADRPEKLWPRDNGTLAMVTLPLDFEELIAAGDASGESGPVLAGGRWGHFHFRVTDLDRSEKFYSETLGVTLTQRYGSSARFLSVAGYHHHLGLNTWGHPRAPHPDAALGLAEVTFARTDGANPQILRDPDGITLRLTRLDSR